SCAMMAPAGVRSVVVYFHKSHMTQRKGRSRLVRKTVATSSTSPSAVRSCSTSTPCALYGSTARRTPSGRRASTHSSSHGGSSLVERMEHPPVGRLAAGEQLGERLPARRPVLEAALLEQRHVQPRHLLDAGRDDLALEAV